MIERILIAALALAAAVIGTVRTVYIVRGIVDMLKGGKGK